MSGPTECAGLFGRLFGHCFKPAFNEIMSDGGNRFFGSVSSMRAHESVAAIAEALKDRALAGYVCRRCGAASNPSEAQP